MSGYVERLLEAVYNNEGLSAILDIAAQELGNPTCLLDMTNPMVVGSSHEVPTDDEMWIQTVYQRRARSLLDYPDAEALLSLYWNDSFAQGISKPAICDVDSYKRRLVGAFRRAGTRYLFVALENDRPFVEEDLRLVLPTMQALALVMRRILPVNSTAVSFSSLLDEAINGAIDGESLALIAREGGIEVERGSRLVMLAAYEPEAEQYTDLIRKHSLIEHELGCDYSTIYDQESVFVIGLHASKTFLTRCDDILRSLGTGWALGVSLPIDGVEGLAVAYREACKSCDACRDGIVMPYDELWVQDVLRNASGFTSLDGWYVDKLREMRAYDALHGTEYLRTIKAHLDCQFDRSREAEELCVHVNTVSYRLGRIEVLFGIDFRNPTMVRNLSFASLVLECLGR